MFIYFKPGILVFIKNRYYVYDLEDNRGQNVTYYYYQGLWLLWLQKKWKQGGSLVGNFCIATAISISFYYYFCVYMIFFSVTTCTLWLYFMFLVFCQREKQQIETLLWHTTWEKKRYCFLTSSHFCCYKTTV